MGLTLRLNLLFVLLDLIIFILVSSPRKRLFQRSLGYIPIFISNLLCERERDMWD